MQGPEQTQRNSVAFNNFVQEYPYSVGVVNGRRAISFNKPNGDEAIVYETGTYIVREGGYKGSPITSSSVHNSIIDLINKDYSPAPFDALQFGKKDVSVRQPSRGRRPGRQTATQPRMPVIQKTALRQFYPHIRVNPSNYSNILKEYNEGFNSLEKSFDEIENRGFNIKRKRGDRV